VGLSRGAATTPACTPLLLKLLHHSHWRTGWLCGPSTSQQSTQMILSCTSSWASTDMQSTASSFQQQMCWQIHQHLLAAATAADGTHTGCLCPARASPTAAVSSKQPKELNCHRQGLDAVTCHICCLSLVTVQVPWAALMHWCPAVLSHLMPYVWLHRAGVQAGQVRTLGQHLAQALGFPQALRLAVLVLPVLTRELYLCLHQLPRLWEGSGSSTPA
jgi:hypothetical protein